MSDKIIFGQRIMESNGTSDLTIWVGRVGSDGEYWKQRKQQVKKSWDCICENMILILQEKKKKATGAESTKWEGVGDMIREE